MIKGIPPLSPKEERECLQKAKAGDKAALDKIILSNQGFVFNCANAAYKKLLWQLKSYCPLELDDIISIGNIGLMRAIKTFDIKRATRFLTYAGYWIKAYIDIHIKKEINITNNSAELSDADKDIDKLEENNIKKIEESIDLSMLSKDLTDEEKTYLYMAINVLPIPLTKQEIANILLKPSTRSINMKKKIKEKLCQKLKR